MQGHVCWSQQGLCLSLQQTIRGCCTHPILFKTNGYINLSNTDLHIPTACDCLCLLCLCLWIKRHILPAHGSRLQGATELQLPTTTPAHSPADLDFWSMTVSPTLVTGGCMKLGPSWLLGGRAGVDPSL